MWVLTLGTFVFSWMLWKAFLENTDKSNYCIEDAGMLDAGFGAARVIGVVKAYMCFLVNQFTRWS